MTSSKSASAPSGLRPKNKLRRQAAYLSNRKAKEAEKRDLRFRRKREEAKDPQLREGRLRDNVPATIDGKRKWDTEGGVGDESDMLGWSVDVEAMAKRRKLQEEEAGRGSGEDDEEGILAQLKKRDGVQAEEDEEADLDSMLDDTEEDEDEKTDMSASKRNPTNLAGKRAASPGASSLGTNLELTPELLKQKFPALFDPPSPKILMTTSINSTLWDEAKILTSFFPACTFIRRSAHVRAHKYSVREIATYASARNYTTLVVLNEAFHEKKPSGLDIVVLPSGPMFHFSMSNWIPGKAIPGHGKSSAFIPELILNNFRTPLGMLTAHLFKSLFPAQPQLSGREVVTMHNQRDYIFFRRHRYVFRERKGREKSVVGADGKVVTGDIRAGLQELGPRFTLKLRRIDRGIQWKSGQEWEWKPKLDKERTRFTI